MKELAKKSKLASKHLMKLDHYKRTNILKTIAENLIIHKQEIIAANKLDLEAAHESGLNSAMIDRLKLDEKAIEAMANGVLTVAEQEEVVGIFEDKFTNPLGLEIKKQRIPIGVILMIFESRPNVVVDCAALAIKSSNAIILKGGKEAKNSNEILGQIIQNSIKEFIPVESVQVLASDKREVVNELLELNQYIDVVIPRGGHKLVEFVHKHSKMPVIAHFQGLCHMYLDKDADIEKSINLVLNAKTQRTGVCNAIETLLVHKDLLPSLAKVLVSNLQQKGTELRVDERFLEASETNLTLANDQDWATEYLDNILSIRTVNSIDEAIDHIDQFGTYHTECIVSENQETCQQFLSSVDASCIMINSSSRFNDGGQLGLGAELGISTTKIHAYGPMGAKQMTTTRFVVTGDGHTRP